VQPRTVAVVRPGSPMISAASRMRTRARKSQRASPLRSSCGNVARSTPAAMTARAIGQRGSPSLRLEVGGEPSAMTHHRPGRHARPGSAMAALAGIELQPLAGASTHPASRASYLGLLVLTRDTCARGTTIDDDGCGGRE
jgi:hypothetical protein